MWYTKQQCGMMGGNSEDRKSEVENVTYSGCPYLKLCRNKKGIVMKTKNILYRKFRRQRKGER